jgi:GT2 family glycosyltransferase
VNANRLMNLSIIIVNWNSAEFAKNCIQSIRETTQHVSYEIVVVDNASRDDSCQVLAQAFPDVTLLRSERNLGFAGANNLGAAHAVGEKLLFLNPDTIVLGDAIETMVSRLDAMTEFGAVGCRLLNGDGTLQTTAVQPFPTILNQVLALDWLKNRFPRLPLWGMRALYSESSAGLAEVEVVSGACLMTRREVFEQVGHFSSDYFMYAEESDLCCKIKHAGWKTGYAADAEIVHFGGQSTKKRSNWSADIVMRDSVFKFLQKFRGEAYSWAYRMALLASATLRMMALAPLLSVRRSLSNGDDILYTFRKWRQIGAWALSLDNRAARLRPTHAPANANQP